MAGRNLTSRAWFYPVVYGFLIVISMLPPITQIPYDPRNTQDVIMNILMIILGLVFSYMHLSCRRISSFPA